MEEMEPVVRVGFVPAGLVAGAFAAVGAEGLIPPERLCLPATGAFLTPSEIEARGRVAVEDDLTDAAEPVGETIERVVVGAGFEAEDGAGLAEAEDDRGGFEVEED
jgi:hypothetical protein